MINEEDGGLDGDSGKVSEREGLDKDKEGSMADKTPIGRVDSLKELCGE